MVGGNRLSLTLTLFQNADSPIRLSAITAGGSQAVFFKVNTLGEETFLDEVNYCSQSFCNSIPNSRASCSNGIESVLCGSGSFL